MQLAVEAGNRFELRKPQSGGCLFDGFQPRQHPYGVCELIPQPAQSAIAHSLWEQAVAAGRAALRRGFRAQPPQELDSAKHVRLHPAEVGPILAQLGLPHQGEHGDAGVFPVLPARAGKNATVLILECPGRFQPLLRLSVVAQVSRGLQDEVAVHNPEAAVDRGPNLECQPAILPLAGLQYVARARRQKLAIAARHTP
jgi:hypothetical protein